MAQLSDGSFAEQQTQYARHTLNVLERGRGLEREKAVMQRASGLIS